MDNLNIVDIKMPEHYVRGKINGKNVSDLMDVVVKANGHLFATEKSRDWKELVGKKVVWPFHAPILVAKNKAPVIKVDAEPGKEATKEEKAKAKGAAKKKMKEALKGFKAFELIDGGHRLTVWKRLKQKTIPAITKNFDEPSERFLEQYRTNAAHGLRIDKDGRDNAIRIAHEIYKVSINNLAKETGLDRSSIKRILAEKQRKKGPREKAGKNKSETFSPSATVITDMSVIGFIERLEILLAAFPKLASELTEVVSKVKPDDRPRVAMLSGRLRELANIFNPAGVVNATKASSGNGPGDSQGQG